MVVGAAANGGGGKREDAQNEMSQGLVEVRKEHSYINARSETIQKNYKT